MADDLKNHLLPVSNPYGTSANPFNDDPTVDIPGVMITGPWHPSMADCLVEQDIRALYLNPARGFRCEDYSFLPRLPQLELLSIGPLAPGSYDGPMSISELTRLRHLAADFPVKVEIDFQRLPNLVSGVLKWNKSIESVFGSRSLKRLCITSLNEDRTTSLGQITTLKNLQLSFCGIRSLSDLAPLKHLKFLSLEVCRNLGSLEGIDTFSQLTCFVLNEAHKITSLDPLGSMTQLEALIITDCGEIESLAPLAGSQNLKAVAFAGAKTTIRDGDLTPLTKLPKLSMLMFGARRHYSHKLIKKWGWDNFEKPDQLLVPK